MLLNKCWVYLGPWLFSEDIGVSRKVEGRLGVVQPDAVGEGLVGLDGRRRHDHQQRPRSLQEVLFFAGSCLLHFFIIWTRIYFIICEPNKFPFTRIPIFSNNLSTNYFIFIGLLQYYFFVKNYTLFWLVNTPTVLKWKITLTYLKAALLSTAYPESTVFCKGFCVECLIARPRLKPIFLSFFIQILFCLFYPKQHETLKGFCFS